MIDFIVLLILAFKYLDFFRSGTIKQFRNGLPARRVKTKI